MLKITAKSYRWADSSGMMIRKKETPLYNPPIRAERVRPKRTTSAVVSLSSVTLNTYGIPPTIENRSSSPT